MRQLLLIILLFGLSHAVVRTVGPTDDLTTVVKGLIGSGNTNISLLLNPGTYVNGLQVPDAALTALTIRSADPINIPVVRGIFLIRNASSVHLSYLTFIGSSTLVAIEVGQTRDLVIIDHISTFGSYCNDIRIDQALQSLLISNSTFSSSPVTGCATFHSLYITGSSNYIKLVDNAWSNKIFPEGIYIGSIIYLGNIKATNVLIDQCTITNILQKDQQNLIDFATNNIITQINVRSVTIHNCAGRNQANIFNVAQSIANSIVVQDLRVENSSYVTIASFGTTTVSAITFDGPIFEVLKIDVQVNSPFVSFDNCLFASSSFHAIINNMGGSAILAFYMHNVTFDTLHLFNEIAQITNEAWAYSAQSSPVVMSFTGCTWRNNTGVGTHMVRIAAVSTSAPVILIVSDCVFDNNRKFQSMFYTGYQTKLLELHVERNTLIDNAMPQLTPEVIGRAYVTNNLFSNNNLVNSGICLFISNVQRGEYNITGNTFNGTLGGGISLVAATGGGTIVNNVFSNGTLSALAIDGTWNAVLIDGLYCDGYNTKFARKYGGCISGEKMNHFDWNSFGSVATTQSITRLQLKNSVLSTSTAQEGGLAFISIYNFDQIQVSNVIFRQGLASEGGGLFLYSRSTSGNVTVSDSSFIGNQALSAGGLYVSGQSYSVKLNRLTFEDNAASISGGALLISGQGKRYNVQNSNFTNNNGKVLGGVISITKETQIQLFYFSSIRIVNGSSLVGGCIATAGSVNLTVANSTLISCTALKGGGILSEGDVRLPADLWVAGTQISNSYAQTGGGIFASILTELRLVNNRFTNNQAQYYGGAVRAESSVEKVSSRLSLFDSNVAGANGGGISISAASDVKIMSTIFRNNEATDGGAVSIQLLSPMNELKCTDSSFDGNIAYGSGGGISSTSANQTFISNCNFTSNIANKGGSLHTEQYTYVENSQFTSNNATNEGGAFYHNRRAYDRVKRSEGRGTQIVSSSFEENWAGVQGGACSIVSPIYEVLFDRSEMKHNAAVKQGGAIQLSGIGSVQNSQFSDNSAKSGTAVSLDMNTVSSFDQNDMKNDQMVSLSNSSSARGVTVSSISCLQDYKAVTKNTTVICEYVDPRQYIIQTDPNRTKIIVGSTLAGAFLIVVVAVIIAILIKRRERKKHKAEFEHNLKLLNLQSASKMVIDYADITGKKQIGEGAFGVVYKAKWRQTDVAVKQLLSQEVDREQLASFLDEMALIQGLRTHPNVVLFLGTTIPPQPLSLVTEYCEGGSLDKWLRQNRDVVTIDQQKKFIIGIASGMFHLHKERIIHRDLATRNILLRAGDVKISDFGFSRRQHGPQEINKTSTVVGPLKWMSPEALQRQEYSIKSDMWSFGVVMWEIINCEEPWTDLKPLDAAIGVVAGELRLSSNSSDDQNPDDRPDFGEVLQMFTERDSIRDMAYRKVSDPHRMQSHPYANVNDTDDRWSNTSSQYVQ
ncbi:serine/threonine protein kinase 4, CTR4 [Planoprotostelium fungivorum]|uniref:Serine/threonine protein kinase 4, CTR4 n=1 Tax=Planoprotostelium fungivorum TaxID=1890364 RepID=A0A2P6ND71_9EUKA|nr:serine/threonine protein kinase 4, CTR4 [Planoprotostelium fungivorum]